MSMEKINQRRRQLHVHSYLYYFRDESLVDDATFDRWANELVELQAAHPESLHKGYLPSIFADWTGDTGMHLPVRDEVVGLAEWLLAHRDKVG